MNPPALVVGGLLVVGLFSGLWLFSLRARDVSLVDRLWGPAFALLAACYALTAPHVGPRSLALAIQIGRAHV